MRWKLSLAIPAVVAVFLVWLGWQARPSAEAVSRREAVDLLQPLVDVYGVELSGSQRRLVGSECPQIQEDVLEAGRDRLGALQDKYQGFLSLAGGYIWGLTSQLDAFADDASSLNLAMVELRRSYLDFERQFADYDRSLEIAVAVNCVAYPEQFVAGLHQVAVDHRRLSETAAGLVGFIGTSLPEVFIDTECHLFDIDNPDCHQTEETPEVEEL